MLDNEELLFDELYEKTKDCGRTQFIKLLMEKDREIKELQIQNFNLRTNIMIQKQALPSKEIKDKTFYALLDTPTYEELKIQLEHTIEELELVRCDLHNRTSERNGYEKELNACLSQQREYIKYLEDCITELEKESTNKLQNTINLGIRDITKTILQKYKQIIGADDENNNE